MVDNIDINHRRLKRRFPELADPMKSSLPGYVKIHTTPMGLPTLIISDAKGDVTLHSRFDPVKEAASLAESVNIPEGAVLVVLGFGLGYHVQALLKTLPQNAPVVIVETDPCMISVAARHMDLSYLLEHENIVFLIGLPVEEVEKRLNRLRIDYGFAPLVLLKLPAAQRLAHHEYSRLEQMIRQSGSDRLARTLIQPRFTGCQLKVVILDSGYFLIREISQALKSLGHETQLIHLSNNETGDGDVISRLLTTVADFKPDMLLTVNHLGFDEHGILTDLLDHLKLPFASWFVDSPYFILSTGRRLSSSYGTIFIWDEDYLETVKALGCRRVYYLPLATDTSVFKSCGENGRFSALSCPVSFVGDSMMRPVTRRWEKLASSSFGREDIDAAAAAYIESSDLTPQSIILKTGLCSRSYPFLPDLEQLITWRATQMKRVETVRAFTSLGITVIGDEGWTDLLDSPSIRLHPPLDYYNDLPHFYPRSKINLNITSQQMKNSPNQRVFDVPACGGFVLTDYRRQLETMFDPGREVICYREPEEAEDLTRFYLDHDSERRTVIDQGRQRILAEHTYPHRLKTMVDLMRHEYALH